MNLSDVTLGEFAALMERVQRGDEPQTPAMAPARQPVPPVAEHLRNLSPAQCRARLRELHNEALQRSTCGMWSDVEAREWKTMDLGHRVCLLILAGVGDDLGGLSALADRDWREIPPPEKDAIKTQVRAMRAGMDKVRNLAGW